MGSCDDGKVAAEGGFDMGVEVVADLVSDWIPLHFGLLV